MSVGGGGCTPPRRSQSAGEGPRLPPSSFGVDHPSVKRATRSSELLLLSPPPPPSSSSGFPRSPLSLPLLHSFQPGVGDPSPAEALGSRFFGLVLHKTPPSPPAPLLERGGSLAPTPLLGSAPPVAPPMPTSTPSPSPVRFSVRPSGRTSLQTSAWIALLSSCSTLQGCCRLVRPCPPFDGSDQFRLTRSLWEIPIPCLSISLIYLFILKRT